jgi:uncharacterized protein YndB with AHSA1/START domain
VIEPLRFEFTVACSPEHAFRMWAVKTSLWWPADHTVSADPGLTVTFEPRPGGRIYEHTRAGEEHEWGEVLTWEPPHRLSYLWHLAQDRADATEVDITFAVAGDLAATTVTIIHRGWERLGARGANLRQRNRQGWTTLLPHYERAVAAGT